jgi:hypothetical protein
MYIPSLFNNNFITLSLQFHMFTDDTYSFVREFEAGGETLTFKLRLLPRHGYQ